MLQQFLNELCWFEPGEQRIVELQAFEIDMELHNSFGVLQQCSVLTFHVDLCVAMDLCALTTVDSLFIHRTITWERIFSINISEVLGDKSISTIKFSPVGKLLSVGLSDGMVIIIDIETGDIFPCRYEQNMKNSDPSAVRSLCWQKVGGSMDNIVLSDNISNFGGLNQLQRGGMTEYCDPSSTVPPCSAFESISISLTSPVHARRELIYQLSGYTLLSLTQNGRVCGHVLGTFPLFNIDLSHLQICSHYLIACDLSECGVLVGTERGPQYVGNAAAILGSRTVWLEHCGSLHLCIEANLSRLHDLVASCGRKWKDACKVVLPKLSLMQTLLASYELKMTPVEFCYSIALCGMWHPAAATAFTQHWNDQGLQRLRSTVDAASRSVIKLLQTKAIPMTTNSLLCAKELLGLTMQLSTDSSKAASGVSEEVVQLKALVLRLERVLLYLDDALSQARLAREAMLLYIQFIKDCAYDANTSESSTEATIPGTKPDISLRPKYQVLFDPRCRRGPNTGANAQAEHVTGTHLYAHLQDLHIATAGSAASSPVEGITLSRGVGGCPPRKDLDEIYEMAAVLSNKHLSACVGMHQEDSSLSIQENSSDCNHSVAHEIKVAKELEHSMFYSIHRDTTIRIQNSPRMCTSLACPYEVPSNSQNSRAVSMCTLQLLSGASATLDQCVLHVNVSIATDSLCITVTDLGVVCKGTHTSLSQYSARIALSSLVLGLRKDALGGSNEHDITDAHVCIYCRPSSHQNSATSSSDVSVLIAIDVHESQHTDTSDVAASSAETVGVFLCKLSLEEILFQCITRGCDETALPAQTVPEDALRSRKLNLRDVVRLCCSAERGVALVCDAMGRMVVLDVEAEEEGEEDSECDSKTSGAMSESTTEE